MGLVLYSLSNTHFLKSCYLLSTILDSEDPAAGEKRGRENFLPSKRLLLKSNINVLLEP